LPPKAIADLRNKLRGRIILPGDAGYDDARMLKNPRFDPRPSAIVLCAVESDVGHILDALRRFGVSFTVRSGGHSTAGYSASDGVLVDVRGLNTIVVNASAQTATIGVGCTNGEVHQALSPHGLHIPLGSDEVGVGGFVQGGGYGLSSRIFGMNCDNVLELRVMLADGRIVRANESINHDLWWAVRGGTGGNFGVLLSVQYRLSKPENLTNCTFSWDLPAESGSDRWRNQVDALMVLQRYYTGGCSPQVGAAAGIRWEQVWSKPPTLWIETTFVGVAAEFDAALKPLRDIPGSTVSCTPAAAHAPLARLLVDEVPRDALLLTADPRRPPSYRKSVFVSQVLGANDWRAIIDKVKASPTHYPEFEMHCYGGAINAYPRQKSAFIHRDSSYCCFLQTRWWNDKERILAERHLQEWCLMMGPFSNGHVYQNFPSEDYADYRWAYWGSAFPTLLKVKNKYDPHRRFAFPQMIRKGRAASPEPPLVALALAQTIDEG
jgi:hypothetical protein